MDKKSTQRWRIGIAVSLFGIAVSVLFALNSARTARSASESSSRDHRKLEAKQKQILTTITQTQVSPELALIKQVALIDVLTDANGHQVAESFRDLFVNIGRGGGKNVSMQWKNVLAEIPGTGTKFYAPESDKIEPATPMALGPNDRAIMPELPNVFQSSIGDEIKTATAELDVKYDGTDDTDEKSYCKSYSAKFVRAVDGGLVLHMSEIEPEPRIASLDAADWF